MKKLKLKKNNKNKNHQKIYNSKNHIRIDFKH